MKTTLSLVFLGALAASAQAYDIRYEGSGLGVGGVDYKFYGSKRSAFAGQLTFKDLQKNILFKSMCADLEHTISNGQVYNVVEKDSATQGSRISKAGSVFANNVASVNSDNKAAALQIAVWAARYGTNLNTNSGGDFQLEWSWVSSHGSIFSQAKAYFGNDDQNSAVYLKPSPIDGGQAQLRPVPEPFSLLAAGLGLAALAKKRRR
ncbi:MAG: hypothetical protein JST30_04110 [Armatimonadetes bacterium]|nr:hypothetical protein [Armatimonadota bacterium]